MVHSQVDPGSSASILGNEEAQGSLPCSRSAFLFPTPRKNFPRLSKQVTVREQGVGLLLVPDPVSRAGLRHVCSCVCHGPIRPPTQTYSAHKGTQTTLSSEYTCIE